MWFALHDQYEINSLFASCEWISFVNTILRNPNVTVNGSEYVMIPGKQRLTDMYKMINEMPKQDQANILLWRIFAKFASNWK